MTTTMMLLGATGVVVGGEFQITSVSPSTSPEEWLVGVEMTATAQYMGTLDANDDAYLIQTFMNDNETGGSLDDWNSPDHWGDGKSGTGITENMVLTCTGSCAAYANFWRKECPTTYNYKGKGGVTIYHQYTPETDIDYSTVYTVDCYWNNDGSDGARSDTDEPCNG